MNTEESLRMVAISLAPAYVWLAGLAALGGLVMAFVCEVTARSKKKVFFDKYAQQLTTMSLLALCIFSMAIAGGVFAGASRSLWLKSWLFEVGTPFLPFYVGLGIVLVLSLPYWASWKKFRKNKPPHIALGALTTVVSLFTIVASVLAVWVLGITGESGKVVPMLQLFSAAGPYALPLVLGSTCLALSTAAAGSLKYLVFRRNKDDFGRDYYRFALSLAARWAWVPMLGALACAGWMFAVLPQDAVAMISGTALLYVVCVEFACLALCIVLWLLIDRSETPMRLKWAGFVAAGLLWVAVACDITLLFNLAAML